MTSILDNINPTINGLPVYQPGRPIEEVARELGLDPSAIIKVASNENPLGISPLAKKVLNDASSEIHRYPDGNGFYLKEALSKNFLFETNQIIIGNGSNEEEVLDGYDVELASQVPHLHWANVFVNHYKWYGVKRGDIEGRKYGSELSLLPSLNLEVAYDDKTIKGLKDEHYIKLNFVYPPRQNKPTVLDGISKEMWVVKKI